MQGQHGGTVERRACARAGRRRGNFSTLPVPSVVDPTTVANTAIAATTDCHRQRRGATIWSVPLASGGGGSGRGGGGGEGKVGGRTDEGCDGVSRSGWQLL